MSNKNKNKEGVVYSTNPDFEYSWFESAAPNMKDTGKQNLRVQLDTRRRAGKQVTLITGFIGPEKNLEELSKKLKNLCGTGGSAKDGEIIIQGDHRQKVYTFLSEQGYKTKLI